MLDSIRTRLYGVLASKTGNGFLPVRLAKGAALYANDVVGRPLAPASELEERRDFEKAIADKKAAASAEARRREQAPIVIFHVDRHPREVAKLGELLRGEGLEFEERNVADDEAALSAAKMDSGSAKFPMLFIAGDYIGGVEALSNLINRKELDALVFPG